jgi:hypothetical protein
MANDGKPLGHRADFRRGSLGMINALSVTTRNVLPQRRFSKPGGLGLERRCAFQPAVLIFNGPSKSASWASWSDVFSGSGEKGRKWNASGHLLLGLKEA